MFAPGISEWTKLVELRQTFGKVEECFWRKRRNLVRDDDVATQQVLLQLTIVELAYDSRR